MCVCVCVCVCVCCGWVWLTDENKRSFNQKPSKPPRLILFVYTKVFEQMLTNSEKNSIKSFWEDLSLFQLLTSCIVTCIRPVRFHLVQFQFTSLIIKN